MLMFEAHVHWRAVLWGHVVGPHRWANKKLTTIPPDTPELQLSTRGTLQGRWRAQGCFQVARPRFPVPFLHGGGSHDSPAQ